MTTNKEIRNKIIQIMLASTPEDVSYHVDKIISLMKAEQKHELMQRTKEAVKAIGTDECSICKRYREMFKDTPHLGIDKCPYHQGKEDERAEHEKEIASLKKQLDMFMI